MKSSHSRTGKEALVIEEEDLKALYELLIVFAENVNITAECSDNITRIPNDLNELLAYENSKGKELCELRFHGFSNNRDKSVRLKLSNRILQSYELEIDGPEECVSKLVDSIQEKITGMRAWYNFVAKTSLFGLGIAFMILITIASKIISDIIPETAKNSSLSSETWQQNAAMVGIAITIIGGPPILGYILDRIKGRVFPVVTFAIGQGIKRHRTCETLRTIVFFGFIVSLAASMVAYWITKI